MIYSDIIKGIFLERPNRFIAHVDIGGRREVCHVKNTGRCRELLLPGVTVVLQKGRGEHRKTAYDLIAVYKGDRLINIDSQVPNKVFAEWLKRGELYRDITLVKPESRFGRSRFDFYLEADGRKVYVEVKGVTLEEGGIARFPDAPTERGVRHLQELIDCVAAGYDALLVFVVQMKGMRQVEANRKTHPAFGEALKAAAQGGVRVLALGCTVTEDSIVADSFVPVKTGL